MGCDDFLDKSPSKTSSLVPTTVEQLDALLGAYSSFYQVSNRNSVYATDDYGLYADLYDARPASYNLVAVQYALWDMNRIAFDGRIAFWPNEYKKIFTANMVLQNLSKVSGSDEEKAILEAESHLIRAYSYLDLADKYCLPYSESTKDELGLPLKQSVSFEELSSRNTLSETYASIESDLQEALKTPVHLLKDGRVRSWRANIGAANALAARYYLGRNNYAEALKYANAALSEYSTLVDYNTEMKYSDRPNSYTINPNDPEKKAVVSLKFPYTHDNQTDMTDMLGWKEFYYFRLLNHESWWYVPSKELLDLYGRSESDLRYKYHIVEDYSYDRGMLQPSYSYPGYVFFFKDRIPAGPTVAEMILTKAECLARDGNIPEAINTVNILRAKRMDNSLPADKINLSATTREEAVKKILEERRREIPFSIRWFDIRRFNANADTFDDVVITREFYPYAESAVLPQESVKTYTLGKDSRRYAVPVPNTEIISSGGKIEQNKY
ncbi:hypothetical protein FACS189426_22160 [Bacteroidia bacterium]|nr:hypothetical protein FACS189426_22160 [Bacteroidia bacterium]